MVDERPWSRSGWVAASGCRLPALAGVAILLAPVGAVAQSEADFQYPPCRLSSNNRSIGDPAAMAILHDLPVQKTSKSDEIPDLDLYLAIRKIVIAHGWLPLRSPECVFSADKETCRRYPELDQCSNGPVSYCISRFHDPKSACILEMDTVVENTEPGETFTSYDFRKFDAKEEKEAWDARQGEE